MPLLRKVPFLTLALGGGLVIVWLIWGLSRDGQAQERRRVVTNSLGMKFALIPRGQFAMGSLAGEVDRNDDETIHNVAISKEFYLDIHEVTQKQYEAVMGQNPSFFTPIGPGKAKVKSKSTNNHPVERVSWNDAVAFCKKLGELADEKEMKHTYRLPTEAEWEYACRAGTSTGLAFGDKVNSYKANFNGLSPYGDAGGGPFLRCTSAVAEFQPNGFGLFDMHGNVLEWCSDWYGGDFYKNSPVNDPTGPAKGYERVLRGGAWVNSGKACRSAVRNKMPPDHSSYSTGFRVVLVVGK